MNKILCLIIALLLTLSAAHAEQTKVKAALISETTAIVPGQPFWVAVKQDIAPGWHTYWRNPGDSGLATSIEWTLPSGFTAGDILWPTPHRITLGKLVNFGFENQATLPVKIIPPQDLKTGDKVNLTAAVDWLVCADVCIPESAVLHMTLPVAASAKPQNSKIFDSARAALPTEFSVTAAASLTSRQLILTLDGIGADLVTEAAFFPDEPLIIQNNAAQQFVQTGQRLTVTIPLDATLTDLPKTMAGEIVIKTAAGEHGFIITRDIGAAMSDHDAPSSMWSALLLAFLGGLILNLMPCVFPVLSIKALALLREAYQGSRRHIITGGVVYAIGVMLSFWVLAGILLGLKTAGNDIGWGIQLQSPQAVAALALVLFVIGLLLAGVATIGGSFVNFGSRFAAHAGHTGTFFTGVLAVLVATPCTAPFMGGAVFYALTQPWYISFLVFTALGLGLAAPYLILTLYPPALKFLPRPGPWMERFKQFLAFPMFAASIWLVWVLAQQVAPQGLLLCLISMLAAAFGLWLWQTTSDDFERSLWSVFKRFMATLVFVGALLAIANIPMHMNMPNRTAANAEAYSAERLASLRAAHQPVLVDMGAAWCITCLVNEHGTLDSDAVRELFALRKITLLKGDWTNHDAAITAFLKQFNRNGVPLYVYYPAKGEPVLLPQILTPAIVRDIVTAQ